MITKILCTLNILHDWTYHRESMRFCNACLRVEERAVVRSTIVTPDADIRFEVYYGPWVALKQKRFK